MAKICLITPGQPSIDPRLVKEADALVEAGHDVHVLCSRVVAWADKADKNLLAKRTWTCSYVGGDTGSLVYTWTRLRHGLIRRLSGAWSANSRIAETVLTRVTPELIAAAVQYKAELYIAHYSGALVAAAQAARSNGQQFAFDAEDFETGYSEIKSAPNKIDRLIEHVERTYLQGCCYVTAASPGIASAYHAKYGIPMPTSILNVFSVAERPLEFRTPESSGPLRLYWFSQTIGPGRGLEDVIRAIGKLRHYRVELHLRGNVRPEYWKHLRGLAMTEGVAPDALFLLGPCAPDELIREAAEFDVGLALEHPTSVNKDLCLSNKLFSYILAGNAIAATATAAQRDILEVIGGAGFLYAPGDVDALVRGLRMWIQDRAMLLRARQESWFWGTQRFKWEIEKGKFLRVIDGVLSKRERVKRAG
jgi:glycosyltransferase involved in cell wall biosynthesis